MLRARRQRVYSVRRGHRGTVYLDGEPVAKAFACKTGERGWVKYYETDDQGALVVVGNDIALRYKRGQVTFVPESKRKAPATQARSPRWVHVEKVALRHTRPDEGRELWDLVAVNGRIWPGKYGDPPPAWARRASADRSGARNSIGCRARSIQPDPSSETGAELRCSRAQTPKSSPCVGHSTSTSHARHWSTDGRTGSRS